MSYFYYNISVNSRHVNVFRVSVWGSQLLKNFYCQVKKNMTLVSLEEVKVIKILLKYLLPVLICTQTIEI